MQTNESRGLETPTDDSIDPLDALEFSQKTGKRATHEALDLTPRDGHVEVRNESHADGDAHTYRVDVVAGLPARCTCPAWEYHDGACKHMVRVAMSEPVLEAADPGSDPLVAPDGGVIEAGDEGEVLDEDDQDSGDAEDVVDLADEHGEAPLQAELPPEATAQAILEYYRDTRAPHDRLGYVPAIVAGEDGLRVSRGGFVRYPDREDVVPPSELLATGVPRFHRFTKPLNTGAGDWCERAASFVVDEVTIAGEPYAVDAEAIATALREVA